MNSDQAKSVIPNNRIPIIAYARKSPEDNSGFFQLIQSIAITHPVLWIGPTPDNGLHDSPNIEISPKYPIASPKSVFSRWLSVRSARSTIKSFLKKSDGEEFIQFSNNPDSAFLINRSNELANVFYIENDLAEEDSHSINDIEYSLKQSLIKSDVLLATSSGSKDFGARFNPQTFGVGADSPDMTARRIEDVLNDFIYPLAQKPPHPVVMHTIAGMNFGGAEKLLLNILNESRRYPFELRLTAFIRFSDCTGIEVMTQMAETGTLIDKVPMYKKFDLGDVRAFIRILRRHKVDLIHSHGYKSDIVAALASRITGIPLIATAHGYTDASAKLTRNEKLGRLFVRRAKRVIAVSENVVKSLLDSGFTRSKIKVLPNAIDFEYFSHEPDRDFRREWKIPDDLIVIGTAGRMTEEKAHVNLIRAAAELPQEYRSRIKIVIAGEGPLLNLIEREIEKHDLGEHVLLPGFVRDMRSFYSALDIFCLPSLTEGAPLTLLEAAAASRPVVATRVGAIPTLVDDNNDGITVDASDIKGMAEGFIKLVDSPDLRSQFAGRLYEKLRNEYDITAWATEIFDLYNDVLKK